MKCFYHNSLDAVGICKNCNKGVCIDCAADVTNGIACKNSCETEVEAINQIVYRSKTSYQKASSAYLRNAFIFLLLGIIFLIYGGIDISSRSVFGWFTFLIGIVFVLGAIFYFSLAKKYTQN